MHSKIKVLHIIKSLGRGGAEMLLPETLKLHNKEQFEFHYIYFLPWKNQMVDAIEKNGGRVTCYQASNNLQILLQSAKVKKYITDNGIQLVHCHLPWAGILGRLLHRQIRIPVIYTEHNKQERYHFLTKLVNRMTFSFQSAVIAVSKDVADSIQTNIGSVVPVHTVANGVNTAYFERRPELAQDLRRQLEIPDQNLVIGNVAVFRFQKRLSEWLEVFKKVSDRYPDMTAIIVGDGPLRGEIHARCKELGLEKRVIFAGLQTDVRAWLSLTDIFMMTSIFEGLPIALLEAMSMECAIASTDAGGIKEVVESNKNGLLVPVDQWQELAPTLDKMITDVDLRYRLAKGARERIIAGYSMERMVSQLEQIYLQYL